METHTDSNSENLAGQCKPITTAVALIICDCGFGFCRVGSLKTSLFREP